MSVPLDRVRVMLERVKFEGCVLDRCGSTHDAVSKILEERRCKVIANDASHR